jgi:hypothetical protein
MYLYLKYIKTTTVTILNIILILYEHLYHALDRLSSFIDSMKHKLCITFD